jgi:hypothetical protein
MLSKTKIARSAAIVLSNVFPASAAIKHHRVNQFHRPIYNYVHRPIYNMVPSTVGGGCPANGGPECSSAARDLALVHHQIAGDDG